MSTQLHRGSGSAGRSRALGSCCTASDHKQLHRPGAFVTFLAQGCSTNSIHHWGIARHRLMPTHAMSTTRHVGSSMYCITGSCTPCVVHSALRTIVNVAESGTLRPLCASGAHWCCAEHHQLHRSAQVVKQPESTIIGVNWCYVTLMVRIPSSAIRGPFESIVTVGPDSCEI